MVLSRAKSWEFSALFSYAAPVFGLIASVIMLVAGMAWLEYRIKQLHKNGEGFDPIDAQGNIIATPEGIGDTGKEETVEIGGESFEGSSGGRVTTHERTQTKELSVQKQGLLGLVPILVVIAVNFAIVYWIADLLDTSYLAEEKYGATNLGALLGVWSPTIALALAVLVIIAMFPRRAQRSFKELSEGAKNAILPCMTTASEVGYGAVIASLAVFAVVKSGMLEVSSNALVVSTVSTAVISGITGSSSGGLSITMQTLGEQLAQLASEQGISPELMHRVTAMASVSFDSLPHNGAVLTMLMVCGMTHRLSYKDVAMVTVAIPLATLFIMLGLNAVIPGLS